jgi:hypothetical protein
MTSPEVVNSTQFSDPKPYYPHRGSPEKRAQPTQGKLFQEPKPVAEHRYPRGYTPERMDEVRTAMVGKIHSGGAFFDSPSYSGTGATLDSPFNVPHGPRLVREAIARSDVPVKDLRGLNRLTLEHGMRAARAFGSYDPPAKSISMEPVHGSFANSRGLMITESMQKSRKGITRTAAKPWFDAALIHEIGHHVDFSRAFPKGINPLENREVLTSPLGRGKAEGKADTYMLKRFRNDPRNQRRTKFDPALQTYGGKGNILRGYPKKLAVSGMEAAVSAQKAGQEQERTNKNRKAAASQTRKAVTRYRQSQRRRRS